MLHSISTGRPAPVHRVRKEEIQGPVDASEPRDRPLQERDCCIAASAQRPARTCHRSTLVVSLHGCSDCTRPKRCGARGLGGRSRALSVWQRLRDIQEQLRERLRELTRRSHLGQAFGRIDPGRELPCQGRYITSLRLFARSMKSAPGTCTRERPAAGCALIYTQRRIGAGFRTRSTAHSLRLALEKLHPLMQLLTSLEVTTPSIAVTRHQSSKFRQCSALPYDLPN